MRPFTPTHDPFEPPCVIDNDYQQTPIIQRPHPEIPTYPAKWDQRAKMAQYTTWYTFEIKIAYEYFYYTLFFNVCRIYFVLLTDPDFNLIYELRSMDDQRVKAVLVTFNFLKPRLS